MDTVFNWKSNAEIEEERQREKAEKARKEAEERKRREEIETSTDPSMDEIGQVYEPRMYYGDMGGRDSRYITMTRSEALLKGHTNWKSNAEIEEERQREKAEKARKEAEERKRREEIETSVRITLFGIEEDEVKMLGQDLKKIVNTDTIMITSEDSEYYYL